MNCRGIVMQGAPRATGQLRATQSLTRQRMSAELADPSRVLFSNIARKIGMDGVHLSAVKRFVLGSCAVLALLVMSGAGADSSAGVAAFRAGDYGRAISELTPPAAAGEAEAQFYLGVMYAAGWGTVADPAVARSWYERAADQGFAKAEHNLGALYRDGVGLARDPVQARIWFERAATHSSARAAAALGTMYYRGDGGARDFAAAADWWRRAFEGGEADAGYNLGIAYRRGVGVNRDFVMAAKCWQRAARAGSILAQNALGSAYLSGEGVIADRVKAYGWYRHAAVGGLSVAVQNAELLFNQLSETEREAARAFAADLNIPHRP